MIVDKVHEIIFFIQSIWLEKYISFKTQKRNEATKDFDNGFQKLMNTAFYV